MLQKHEQKSDFFGCLPKPALLPQYGARISGTKASTNANIGQDRKTMNIRSDMQLDYLLEHNFGSLSCAKPVARRPAK